MTGTEPTHTLAAVREAVAAFGQREFTGAHLIHYLNWEESEAATFVGNALRKLEAKGLIETCGKVKGKTSPRLLWRRKEKEGYSMTIGLGDYIIINDADKPCTRLRKVF